MQLDDDHFSPASPVVGSAYEKQPKPYSFGYSIADDEGNQQQRAEVGDGDGVVRGTYGILDRHGYARQVVYVADDNGFRVSVASNEPGTKSSSPAAAVFSVGSDQHQLHPHLSGEEVVLPPPVAPEHQPIVLRLSKRARVSSSPVGN